MSSAAIVLLVIVVGFVVGVLVRRWRIHAERRRHAEKVEEMAKRAEADHEGAKTRHEGGA